MTGRLHELGLRHGTDKATFHGYCDFYEQHLPARIDRLLEIGVMDGASLRMWADYYPDAQIDGMDITLRPTALRDKPPNVALWHRDATRLNDLLDLPTFDVIIDDGSHMTADQQRTFDLLWPKLRPGGVYVIEDLHTSYMSNYVNSPRTTLEWLVDLSVLEEFAAVDVWRRPQGQAEGFLARHGFPVDALEWSGPEIAESITSIITKAAREPIGPTVHDEVHEASE